MWNKKYFFRNEPYTGDAAFIDGFNGYTNADGDGLLCALIAPKNSNPSCWSADGIPNSMVDENNEPLIDRNKRGLILIFKDGKIINTYRQ